MATTLAKRRGRPPKNSVAPLPPLDGPPPAAGDNARAVIAAENAQFLSIMSILGTAVDEHAKVKVIEKAAADKVSEVCRTAKNVHSGFTRTFLLNMLTEMRSPEKRRNNTEEERKRARFRRLCGLPVGDSDEQLELESRMPEPARDEMFFQAQGYTAGIAGQHGKPPPEVPGSHIQAWMKGWGDGQTILAGALKTAKNTPPPAPRPPKAAPKAPEPTIGDDRLAEQREIKAAKAALEKIGSDKTPADDFEASPEELAAQAGRPVSEEPAEAV